MKVFGLKTQKEQITLYFSIPRHRDLTSHANEGRLPKLELATVVLANWAQDSNQSESRLHFDNCAFQDAVAYYVECWTGVQAHADSNRQQALIWFGRLLHTVQDFYSHSNWTELHANEDPIPRCDFLAPAPFPPSLVSGVYQPGEPKRCAPGTKTHDDLNKDEPSSPAGRQVVANGPHQGMTMYDLAYELALEHTRAEFDRVFQYL